MFACVRHGTKPQLGLAGCLKLTSVLKTGRVVKYLPGICTITVLYGTVLPKAWIVEWLMPTFAFSNNLHAWVRLSIHIQSKRQKSQIHSFMIISVQPASGV